MTIYYQDDLATLYHGDCLDVLASMPDNSIDSIVTDPPYGLSNTTPEQVAETITRWVSGDREYLPTGRGFMGKEWDSFVPPVAVWDECLRVLKPGGHVVAFAGSRTHDFMTLSIRLAGFEIRDSLAWLYGSGFPKSMDVSKAIESTIATGKSNSRSLRKTEQDGDGEPYTLTGKNNGIMGETRTYERKQFTPSSDDAKQWDGWGTALKPAFEPIVLARKPFPGTVARNVLEHGTGAINVDACRVSYSDGDPTLTWGEKYGGGKKRSDGEFYADGAVYGKGIGQTTGTVTPAGRWPANVLLDEHAATWVDEQSGVSVSRVRKHRDSHEAKESTAAYGDYGVAAYDRGTSDEGGASRFFYVAKAPKTERPNVDGIQHPTVKPLKLMRWLLRLVTPPGGTTLDPFAGSGTTIEAAILESFHPVGIERETDYLPLITARITRTKTPAQTALNLGTIA